MRFFFSFIVHGDLLINADFFYWSYGFSSEALVFDPLGINPDETSGLSSIWESFLSLLSPSFESSSGSKRDKLSSGRGVAGLFTFYAFDYCVV